MTTTRLHQLFFFLVFCAWRILSVTQASAQTVNGEVLFDSPDFKIVRVWGTHAERGFAYGYLSGNQISALVANYLRPGFGAYYNTARNLIQANNNFVFDERHLTEFNAIVEGMNAAGNNTANVDLTDLLIGNSLLDIQALMGVSSGLGCSSLMSWGDATEGTALDGHAVVTRHLDWASNTTLLNSHLMVVHQPSEQDEQNWIMVGFAGMASALSGINNQVAAFQHVMNDFSGSCTSGKGYKPIWMAMRQALEMQDYNNDGMHNVADLKASFDDSPNGFAAACLINVVAEGTSTDSLTAMVAELAPQSPTHTYRTNSYEDFIPGDNLYSANYMIARNDAMHLCTRYNNVINHIGNGTMLGIEESWELMRDWSHQSNNIQLMQYAPYLNHFRFAVKKNQPAYQSDYVDFDLNELLNETTRLNQSSEQSPSLFPNPAGEILQIQLSGLTDGPVSVEITDLNLQLIDSFQSEIRNGQISISTAELQRGVYLLKVGQRSGIRVFRFIKW